MEEAPDYEQCPAYTKFYAPYGIHWGMCVPVEMSNEDKGALALMGVGRGKAGGRYSDEEWARWDRAGAALRPLDRQPNPWADLPAAGYHEARYAMLWIDRHGHIVARGREAHSILFLAQPSGMGSPDWARPDWHALPCEARTAAQAMFADNGEQEIALSLSSIQPWGRFDFRLEKMSVNLGKPEPIIAITLRHYEPADIAVARKLWGWPLSPQEKRVLIATARNASLAQIAELLGLTVGTLKNYINELQTRLHTDSRQAFIERILAAADDDY